MRYDSNAIDHFVDFLTKSEMKCKVLVIKIQSAMSQKGFNALFRVATDFKLNLRIIVLCRNISIMPRKVRLHFLHLRYSAPEAADLAQDLAKI